MSEATITISDFGGNADVATPNTVKNLRTGVNGKSANLSSDISVKCAGDLFPKQAPGIFSRQLSKVSGYMPRFFTVGLATTFFALGAGFGYYYARRN